MAGQLALVLILVLISPALSGSEMAMALVTLREGQLRRLGRAGPALGAAQRRAAGPAGPAVPAGGVAAQPTPDVLVRLAGRGPARGPAAGRPER
ncbi:hypothetical protein ACL02O_03625 [Micromonospora sp. MS34]|uniref:hypothetical protein n=1 Tax=Micromonospora sp. MS34 TaxID=3385971 RepID=UPI0039A26780